MDSDDDDDDVLIIDNPHPRPPPPVVVLLSDSEGDDDNIRSIDDDEKKKKEKNNETFTHKKNQLLQMRNMNCIVDIPSSDESDSSCSLIKETLGKEKAKSMKDWYENYKTRNSTSIKSSSYTCPECRAGVSTIDMIDRHLRSRHPKSLHRFQKDNSYNPPVLLVLSDTEGSPVLHCRKTLQSNSTANKIDKETSLPETDNLMSQPSLKLNPLPVISRLHPLSEGTTNSPSQIEKNSSLSTSNHSLTVCRLAPQNLQPSSILNPSTMIAQPILTVPQSASVTLPPLSRIRSNVQSSSSTVTTQSTMETKSSNSSNNNSKNNPLTVVIYSPNHEQAQTRMVQINSDDLSSSSRIDANITSTKKRKRESFMTYRENPPKRRPEESTPKPKKGKEIRCQPCKKYFATLKDKNNHCRHVHNDPPKRGKIGQHQKKRQLLLNSKPILHPPQSLPVWSGLPLNSAPPSIDKLKEMKHIVLIDVDNWPNVFKSDSKFSPSTFVWCFQGGAASWKPPQASVPLTHLLDMNCFYLHPQCGKSKDAADFALCVQAGKLDVLLPKGIPFTVLSGDKGFKELRNQLSLSKREVHLVDPHNKTIDTVLSILNSIAEK